MRHVEHVECRKKVENSSLATLAYETMTAVHKCWRCPALSSSSLLTALKRTGRQICASRVLLLVILVVVVVVVVAVVVVVVVVVVSSC